MNKYTLNIAGYIIRIDSDSEGPDIAPSERFTRNLISDQDYDVCINVHRSDFSLPENAERVFHAPLFEEIKGVPEKTSDNFWSIWKDRSDLFIQTVFPRSDKKKSGILKFSLNSDTWDLYLSYEGRATDPLDYPLDSLLLYYLTVRNSDIMIHGAGVSYSGNGYIFSGVSGKGKTTMAGLWEKSGARVIHDDRLIIRSESGVYTMYNTPVYRNDTPADSKLSKIFLIEHGVSNKLIPLNGAAAVSRVLANCIQQNWNTGMVARLVGSISMMCSSVPVFSLSFKPDRNIIDFILSHE